MTSLVQCGPSTAPFDAGKLDDLLADAGVDVLLASSRHSVRYLLGGYRFFFFEHADAIALSRYTPVVLYPRGRSADTIYIGAGNEDWGTDVTPLWVSEIRNVTWSATDAAREAATQIRRLAGGLRIGIEPAHLPLEAARALTSALPTATLVDATEPLEELRAVKTEAEIAMIRDGSRAVVDAMLATFATTRVGETKADIAERLRREETQRRLTFEYCLIAAGPSLNRAPSDQPLEAGAVLSLDSGAHHGGYVADLARMALAGEPSALQADCWLKSSRSNARPAGAFAPAPAAGTSSPSPSRR